VSNTIDPDFIPKAGIVKGRVSSTTVVLAESA
jgi:hypothetical protein